jgi:hypothetical protein
MTETTATTPFKLDLPQAQETARDIQLSDDWFLDGALKKCSHVVHFPGGKAYVGFAQRNIPVVNPAPGEPTIESVVDVLCFIDSMAVKLSNVAFFASNVKRPGSVKICGANVTAWMQARENVNRDGSLWGKIQSRRVTRVRGRAAFNPTGTNPVAYADLWVNVIAFAEPILTALQSGNMTPIEEDADVVALNLSDDMMLKAISARDENWIQRNAALGQPRVSNQPAGAPAAAAAPSTDNEEVNPFAWGR